MKCWNRFIAVLLSAVVLLPMASCAEDDTRDTIDRSLTLDMRDPLYVCGNNDVDDLYFTSKLCTIPHGSDLGLVKVFRKGEDICVLTTDSVSIISPDGELLSSSTIANERLKASIGSHSPVTDLDGKYLIGIPYDGAGYYITDYQGNEVYSINSIDDIGPLVSVVDLDDGYAVCSEDKAVKYDDENREVSRIDLDLSLGDYDQPELMVQKGNTYVAAPVGFLRLDWDDGNTEYLGVEESSGNVPVVEMFWDREYFTETDIEQNQVYKVAKRSNILRMPPRASFPGFESGDNYIVLDKEHYVAVYSYNNTDITDVVLISADRDNDYAQREKITVQGNNVTLDDSIQRAAYYYNTSQDEYYVEIQSVGDEYDMSVREQADRFRMEIMSEYQNGNTPDIFYGTMFDFMYWGDNGMVADMSPYLDLSDVTDNIRDVMTDDEGHIYQVFSSYFVYGLWGRQKDFDNTELTAEDLMRLPLISNEGISIVSSELLYDMLGLNLRDLYRSGDLTGENVSKIVGAVLSHGTADNTGGTVVTGDDISRVTDLSDLINDSVSNVMDYYLLSGDLNDTPVLVGYPSADGTVRTIFPQGLVALSSSSEHPKACSEFISFLLSDEVQSAVAMGQVFPVNERVLEQHLGYLKDPDSIPADLRPLYESSLIHYSPDPDKDVSVVIPLRNDLADALIAQLHKINTVTLYDWGIRDIINEELRSYYSQGKTVSEVSDLLYSRLLTYARENYQ